MTVALGVRRRIPSPGVDGTPLHHYTTTPLHLLKEIVEKISTPLAKVFNLSLEEGVVPSEWKEANITLLIKKGSKNMSENYVPVTFPIGIGND